MDMNCQKVVFSTWRINEFVLWGLCFTQKDFEHTGYAFYTKEIVSSRLANQVEPDMRNDTTNLLAGTSILSCWRDIMKINDIVCQVVHAPVFLQEDLS